MAGCTAVPRCAADPGSCRQGHLAAPSWKQAEAQLIWKPGLEQLCFSLRSPACWPAVLEPVWKWALINETSLLPGVRWCLHLAHVRHLKPLPVWKFFHRFMEMISYPSLVLFLWKGTGCVHINTIAKSLCNYFSTVVTHQFEYIPAFLFTFKAILIEDVAVAGSWIMRLYLSIKWVYFLWFGWNSAELM